MWGEWCETDGLGHGVYGYAGWVRLRISKYPAYMVFIASQYGTKSPSWLVVPCTHVRVRAIAGISLWQDIKKF